MYRRRYWWSVVGTLMCGCAFTQSTPVGESTICGLSGSDGSAGRTVRVRAIYVTDLKHGALLKDRQCKSVTLSVIDAEEQPVDPSVKKFDEAVWGEIEDVSLRIFLIDASGVFVVRPGEISRGTFTIQRVWDYKRLQGDDWKTAK